MKKTLLIVTICLLQVAAFSQKSKVGIFGGFTSSNMHGKTGGVTSKGNSLSGYTFGLVVDAPIGKSNYSFQPTLQYAQKGQLYSKTINQKNYLALRYAELLVNFAYTTKGKHGSFFVGLGPTVALPLPSTSVIKNGSSKASTAIIFGEKSPASYRSLDYGANVLAGYKLSKGYFLSVGYTFGIRNLLPGDPTDVLKNGSLAVKLGILVNNKK